MPTAIRPASVRCLGVPSHRLADLGLARFRACMCSAGDRSYCQSSVTLPKVVTASPTSVTAADVDSAVSMTLDATAVTTTASPLFVAEETHEQDWNEPITITSLMLFTLVVTFRWWALPIIVWVYDSCVRDPPAHPPAQQRYAAVETVDLIASCPLPTVSSVSSHLTPPCDLVTSPLTLSPPPDLVGQRDLPPTYWEAIKPPTKEVI